MQRLKKIVMSRPVFIIIIAVAIIGSIVSWQHLYYNTPNKVWHDALRKSLAVDSVKMIINQTDGINSRAQEVSYSTANDKIARSTTTLKQDSSTVVVETVGTLDADYSRYTKLDIPGKDLSSILNQWAVLAHKNQATTEERQLLPDAALRLGSGYGVPLVNAPKSNRGELYSMLKQAVTADFTYVDPSKTDGQKTYTYTAQVSPEKYTEYAKTMAHEVGFKALDTVNSADYRSQPSVKLMLTVGVKDRRLIKLEYQDLKGYTEMYSDYGAKVDTSIPKTTTTIDQLQQKLPAD